jgi:SAM-dependent methyltransferase
MTILMHRKTFEPHAAGSVTARTLAYYEHRAQEFRAGTQDHDVSQNVAALGHTAIGLDGAAAFAAMAHADTGCEIWLQDFIALDLPSKRFDGIFANASLFHVPSRELPRVLQQLRASLKPAGLLFGT